ncbi:hypothetical protein, partial [Salmonella sp. s54395]|uniref:hypothetical protein n=1 Tax=Salmonella sp. s54395 TaxID=3159664 RepID=UPI0039812388
MKIPLVFCILVTVTLARDYSGYKTIRITPTSQNDVTILKDFEIDFKTSVEFWQSTSSLQRTVDVLVPSVLVSDVVEFLNSNGLQFRGGIEDIQMLIDSQAQERKLAISSANVFNYDVFHTYEEIRDWTYAFASEHSDLIQVADVS